MEKTRSLDEFALIISDKDNVAVAKKNISKDLILNFKGARIQIKEKIPQGHRFSLVDIGKKKLVRQYGYPFALSKGIGSGQLISKYNTSIYRSDYKAAGQRLFRKKYVSGMGKIYLNQPVGRTFLGYKRGLAGVGTRNYYLIVPTSLCASDVAVNISSSFNDRLLRHNKYRNIDGIVAAAHTEGCGCNNGDIINRLLLTLKNTIAHPNVGAVLIVDLGCEKTNRQALSKHFNGLSRYNKWIDYLSIQETGGTGKSIVKGRNIVLSRLEQINAIRRQEVPIQHLVVGTKCGASDSFSGITANPVIGLTVDKIICAGGSAILSETPEMVGAEANLIRRMTSLKVYRKFVTGMDYYRGLAKKLNVSLEDNFIPGNEKGGLVNLSLKSLGAILKGGSSPIVDFVDYAKKIKCRGLSLMNGPGNDLESLTGMVASGANLILFSTGMGATEGSLVVPVIKISSRTELFKKLRQDIDFNTGILLERSISLDKLSDRLLDLAVEVASGRKTCSEIWKKRSFQIWSAGKLSL